MLRHRSRALIAAAAGALAMVLIPAAAKADAPTASNATSMVTVIPDGSVLVTPEELVTMGATSDAVKAQRDVWNALPKDVAKAQRELNSAEHAKYKRSFNVVSGSLNPDVMTPMIGQVSCASGSYQSYYKLMSDVEGPDCFGGSAGIYYINAFGDWGGTTGVRLSPGSYTGRTLYMLGNNSYYWTVTRGPNDYNWYYFQLNYMSVFSIQGVQIF
ncbi:MAG: hypothetical protein M0Z51_16245 [Propionibacterium sp.]|nr:hypothetical protein [Propionibacterium sp.]